MKYIFKSILVLFLALFTSGCMEVIEIDGKTEIRTDESHTYKVVIVSTEYDSMDSYSWKVISDHKDYNLTNETTSEATFNAKSAGEYTLEVIAKKNRKSFKATIEIEVEEPEIVNGYILPPEPDETLNNSTLLGIDSNDNGVRDDVEIYVIKRYAKDPDFPKTKTALAMQYAWSSQKILDNPTMESNEFEDNALACQYYWFDRKQKDITQRIIELGETDFNASIQESLKARKWRSKHGVFGDIDIKDKVYNTRERIEQSFNYNRALSGNILKSPTNTLDKCQINISELGE